MKTRKAKEAAAGKLESQNVRKDSAEDQAKVAEAGQLMAMEEAIAYLKTTRPTFYRWLRSGKLKGMKIGRQWRFYRNALDTFLKGEAPSIDLAASPEPLMKTIAARLKELGVTWPAEEDSGDRLKAIAEGIVRLGLELGATDIHLLPNSRMDGCSGVNVLLRYRIDGILQTLAEIDSRLLRPILDEFKRMAQCDLHEIRYPQDGRFLMEVDAVGKGKSPDRKSQPVDLRVCFLPTAIGESLTIRVLNSASLIINIEMNGFTASNLESIRKALGLSHGMILITGPTGSGKTTTLYSCLSELQRNPGIKIICIENPVEYLLPNTVQVPLNPRAGLTFANALRAALRSAPNVIMMSDMPDKEALPLLHQAVLSGILVLLSYHADSMADAVRRLAALGEDASVVADTVKFVESQRLVRILCKECSRSAAPSKEDLEKAAEMARKGGLDWNSLPKKYRTAVGCPKCGMTGYRSRRTISEMFPMTPEIAAAVRKGAGPEELEQLAVRQGMKTLATDGIRRFADGETTLDEIIRVLKI